jgi:hypothetical protein
MPWKKRIGINKSGLFTIRYNKGARVNINPEIMRSLRLPILSARNPIGKENIIPAKGDAAAIIPRTESEAPKPLTKRGRTGFLEIVVEKIPKKPIRVIYHVTKEFLFFISQIIISARVAYLEIQLFSR